MSKTSANTSYIKEIGEQTVVSTIVWSGSAAPSNVLSLVYRWTQIGKMVTVWINLSYNTAGTTNTSVIISFPSDLPVPLQPAGFISASENLYTGIGSIGTSTTTPFICLVRIKNNAANNGYEIHIGGASVSAKTAHATVSYRTA